jgi:hypothetical protein
VRAIHLAHASGADAFRQGIGSEGASSHRRWGTADGHRRSDNRDRRRLEEARRFRIEPQQRFHFEPQRLIIFARLLQERASLGGWAFQSRVI